MIYISKHDLEKIKEALLLFSIEDHKDNLEFSRKIKEAVAIVFSHLEDKKLTESSIVGIGV